MAFKKGPICHCWDCKHAPSGIQKEWKRQHNRATRLSGKVDVRRETGNIAELHDAVKFQREIRK